MKIVQIENNLIVTLQSKAMILPYILKCVLLLLPFASGGGAGRISNGIATPTKIRFLKALVGPLAMYGCESCTLKKVDQTRINAFEMRCLAQVLRFSWTPKKRTNGHSRQQVLKEDYSQP